MTEPGMIELRHPVGEAATNRAAYDLIYRNETMLLQHDSFFAWAIELLNPRPGGLLLDVCCGTGQSLAVARQYGLRSVGIDFSHVAVQHAARRSSAAVADAEILPLASASVDHILNLGSLEHLEHMACCVREMARVLKPDGTCCIMVPNTFGLFWTIWYAEMTGEVFDDGQPLQRYGTAQQWRRLLETNGLHVVEALPYELPPPRTWQQWATYLRKPKRYWPKLLSKYYLSVNLASMLVFRCAHPPGARHP
jgi:ubiquinone/menaquinone biosynthesis C-methylase UbiE